MHATRKYFQGLMGPAISEGSFKSTKTIHHLIYLQYGRRKQNCYRFLCKTATIDKCAVSLRVISIAYLFGQSLVNILS